MTKVKYIGAPADIEQALESAMTIDALRSCPQDRERKNTIAVDKNSLELFKKYAKKHDVKYQTMINGVLSSYADKFLSHK